MISLELIEEIENRFGGIYQIAENLLKDTLPDTIVEQILEYFDVSSFEEEDPKEQLKFILLDVLEPLDDMGALSLGEEWAA